MNFDAAKPFDKKVIDHVELRAKSIVFFLTDGSRFDFSFEAVEGKHGNVDAAVARINHRVIWTSNDHKA